MSAVSSVPARGPVANALVAQWYDAQSFVAGMADDLAKKIEAGELPPMDGPTALRFLAVAVRSFQPESESSG